MEIGYGKYNMRTFGKLNKNTNTFGRLGQLPSAGGFGRKPQPQKGWGEPATPQAAFEYDNGMCFFMDLPNRDEEVELHLIQEWIDKYPEVLDDGHIPQIQNLSVGGVMKVGVVFWQLGGTGNCNPDVVYHGANPEGMHWANFAKEFHEHRGVPWGQAAMDQMVAQPAVMQQFCDELKDVVEKDYWGQFTLDVSYIADSRFVITEQAMQSYGWTCAGCGPFSCHGSNIYWNGARDGYANSVYAANAAEISQYDLIVEVFMGSLEMGGGSPGSTGVGPPKYSAVVGSTEGLGGMYQLPTGIPVPPAFGPCRICGDQGSFCTNWAALPGGNLGCSTQAALGPAYSMEGHSRSEFQDPNYKGYNVPPNTGIFTPDYNVCQMDTCAGFTPNCTYTDPQGSCWGLLQCPQQFNRHCAGCTNGYFLDAGLAEGFTAPWTTTGPPQPCLWDVLCVTSDLEDVMEKSAGSIYAVASHELGHMLTMPTPKAWKHESPLGVGNIIPPFHNGLSVWNSVATNMMTISPCMFNGWDWNQEPPTWVPSLATGPNGPNCIMNQNNGVYGMNSMNNMGYSQAWSFFRYPFMYEQWGGEDIGCNCGPEVAFSFVNGWMPSTYLHEIAASEVPEEPWTGSTELWISAWDILHIDHAANNNLDNISSGHKKLAVRYPMSVSKMDDTGAPNQHLYITFFGRGHCDSSDEVAPGGASNDGVLLVQWGPGHLNTFGNYPSMNTCPTFMRRNLRPLTGPGSDEDAIPCSNRQCNWMEINPFLTPNNVGDPYYFPGWRIEVVDEVRDAATSWNDYGHLGVRTAVKLRITSLETES